MSWEDSGIRNHIIHEPNKWIGFRFLMTVRQDFLSHHPNNTPIATIEMVSHLRCGGRIYGCVYIGSIHWNIAPLVTDTIDIVIIGIMILILSFIDAKGAWLIGPQMMLIEKRTE